MSEKANNEDNTDDKEAIDTSKEAIAASESTIIMPPDKSAQASYCVKTVQETSASVIRMVSYFKS